MSDLQIGDLVSPNRWLSTYSNVTAAGTLAINNKLTPTDIGIVTKITVKNYVECFINSHYHNIHVSNLDFIQRIE